MAAPMDPMPTSRQWPRPTRPCGCYARKSRQGGCGPARIACRSGGGYTHALVMDADGQHPADRIPAFMAASRAAPEALIMGQPVFGADAPWIRVVSRISNACATVVTLRQVGDTLFGFRVYPIAPLLPRCTQAAGMQRFDFDPEAVVRLAWAGAPLVHLPTPVRYFSAAEDGVSHFKYGRDNLLLTRMFLRLGLEAAVARRALRFVRQAANFTPRADPGSRRTGSRCPPHPSPAAPCRPRSTRGVASVALRSCNSTIRSSTVSAAISL